MRKLIFLVACALMVLTAIGAFSAPKTLTFYAIDGGTTGDPVYTVIDNGFAKAAEDFGCKVVVRHAEGDVAKAVSFLEQAIASKPDGIALNIFDPKAFDDPVKRAVASGIPVIATSQDGSKNNARLAYIGSDNTVDGYQLGIFMQKYFKKGDHIVIPEEVPGMFYAQARSAGIIKAMDQIGVTSEELDAGYEPAETVNRISAYLQGHPETKGIVCVGGLTTGCSVTAIEDLRLKDKVVVGGYDLLPDTLRGLKSGIVKAATDQQLFLHAYYAIVELVMYNYGLFSPISINNSATIVTPETVNKVEKFIIQKIR
jgi:simple sugar transport system substrate-binding protein